MKPLRICAARWRLTRAADYWGRITVVSTNSGKSPDLRVTSENDPGSRFLSPVNSVAPMLSPAVLGVSSPRELRPPPHSEIDEYGPVRVGGGAVQGARTRARDKLVRALLLRRAVC